MNDTKSIKNWLEEERPREKLFQKGADVLTNAELLAILISSGTKELSALDLAKKILEQANNDINDLGKLDIKALQQTKGIGEAKAVTIAAALELGRRRQIANSDSRSIIKKSRDAANIFVPILKDLVHEVFYIMLLNKSNTVIKIDKIGQGGLSSTVADIRVVLKNALLHNASKIIVAHNHPSGSLKPSKEDIQLTEKLKSAAELMDIVLLDHLIIAGNKYLSFGDEGLI